MRGFGRCPYCQGMGYLIIKGLIGEGRYPVCPRCKGTRLCPECKGQKTQSKRCTQCTNGRQFSRQKLQETYRQLVSEACNCSTTTKQSSSASGVEALLKETILSDASFRQAALVDCIAFIRSQVKRIHPDATCNIVVRGQTVDNMPKVTLDLQNVSAYRVLQEICEQSEYKMEISEEIITLSPLLEKTAQSEAKLPVAPILAPATVPPKPEPLDPPIPTIPRQQEQTSGGDFNTIKQQAEQGSAMAQISLGSCYEQGKGVARNYQESVKWYRKSAEQGCAIGQGMLGYCYYNGTGVAQDYAEAVKWFRKAAEQGNALAQCTMGTCYGLGNGVRQDFAEAVIWLRKSAEQGYAIAQNLLGDCYRDGNGVAKDYAEAAKWFRKAAAQGDATAKKTLADCYKKGTGVVQDDTEARKSHRKVSGQGDSVEADQTNPKTMIVGTWLCRATNVKQSAVFTMNFTADGDVVLETKTRKDHGQWILQDGLPYVQWDNWIKVTSITPRQMYFTNKIGTQYVGSKQGVLVDEGGEANNAPDIVAVTAEEYFSNLGKYKGQRITVCGNVTQAIKGMAQLDTYILDGRLRCQFRKALHCTEGAHRETGRYVCITGTATGGQHVTSLPDLVDCDCPFSTLTSRINRMQ